MSPRPIELPKSGFENTVHLAREGRWVEALEAARRRLAEVTDRESVANAAVFALVEVARAAEAGGDLGCAERAFELAVELRPRYPDLHHQLACILIARQKRAEARRALDQALKLNPRFTAARLDLALLDAREGLISDAIASLREMSREVTVEDPGVFQQGLKRLERAEWDDAEPLLRRALDVSDPGLKHRLEQFRALLDQGEAARAAQSLQDILPRHEGYPDLHYLMGVAELRLGHLDDALASLARALELHPDFHEARVQLANALEGLGQSAAAAEQLGWVLERDPSHAMGLDLQRAWLKRMPGERAHTAPARRAAPSDGGARTKDPSRADDLT